MDLPFGQPRPEYAEESAGSGAEGRQRKRVQRTATGKDDSTSRNGFAPPQSKPQAAPASKPTHTRRRSTLMQTKGTSLLGPRPLNANAKRVASDSVSSAPIGSRSYQPSGAPSTGETLFGSSDTSTASRFNFSQSNNPPHDSGTESDHLADFLPSVNFDDLHTRLSDYNPDLDQFPAPNGISFSQSTFGTADTLGSGPLGPDPTSRYIGRTNVVDRPVPSTLTKAPRSSSLVRRPSKSGPRQQEHPNDYASMPPPTAPNTSRPRRQSSLTTDTHPIRSTPNSRPPRSSLGPGMLAQVRAERAAVMGAPLTAAPGVPAPMSRSGSINKDTRRGPTATIARASNELQHITASGRDTKAQSFQAPPREDSHSFLAVTPATPATKSSSRPSIGRTQTPSSSSSKRQSLHVSGLGARTISPVDARRLKRLSAVPKTTPFSQTPLTPQPDLPPPNLRASTHSPAFLSRRSTPTNSARNTPDPARIKSNIPQLPVLSSTPSLNSLRTAVNGGASSRNSQIASTSRLPTPKARNVHSSAGPVEEEVPPVPAIPKAYESPKDQDPARQSSYFSTRKPRPNEPESMRPTSANVEAASKASIRKVGDLAPPVTAPPESYPVTGPRHRRGLTVGTASTTERQPPGPSAGKRNLQPLMLPPLNLLPLDTSANNRIASFPAPSGEVDARHRTPPPARNVAKTPSTPMTASKASFFSRSKSRDDEDYGFFNFRSSTSHHISHTGEHTKYHQGLVTPATPTTALSPAPGVVSTPMVPVPVQASGDSLHPSKAAEDVAFDTQTTTETISATLAEPRPHPVIKKDTPSTRTSTSEEPSTPASTTSLRRKLSLSWKRSSSKASQRAKAEMAAQLERDDPMKLGKTKEMLPPRMPASATWSSNLAANASDANAGRPNPDARFRKSGPNGTTNPNDPDIALFNGQYDAIKTEVAAAVNHGRVPSRSSSSLLLNPMNRMFGSKQPSSSVNTLKARNLDYNLDKDDLAADKIMEKMASKRKDFEQAGKDVDELRKRAMPKEKMTPVQAIQVYHLNIFERGEVIDYKEVYFCGTKNARKHVGDLDSHSNNFGYDDDRGDYNIVLGDHLAYRYEVVDVLGKGSFGQVVRCIDFKTGALVAIKIIRNKKRFHQQALVEVNILQKLREWDPDNKHSMINFTQSFYFRGHLCISTELLSMNLYEFIKAYEFKGFSLPLIRRFTKQMLSSLILLKSKRVIHCDLKPENILLVHPMHSEIKVIDFGSSCFENEKVYTYIQSRFYRSPEVILGMSYGIPIDMWSLGCILAELYTGYPIFPGENEQEQLACIMEIFGPPEKHLIEKSSRKKLFFDSMGKPRVTVSSKGRRRRPSSKTLQQALKCDDDAFLDFVARCLRWDPDRRLKPEEALHHEYITGIRRPPMNTRARGPGGPLMLGPSPAKRIQPSQTPQRSSSRDVSGVRPLPEPPATSFRINPSSAAAANGRDASSSSSPVKGVMGMGMGRRHSTFNNTVAGNAAGVKRTSGGNAVVGSVSASNLPRAAGVPVQRTFSGKPDFASAAAVAASNMQRGQR